AEDGIRDATVTGVQTCALPILDRVLKRGLQAGLIVRDVELPATVLRGGAEGVVGRLRLGCGGVDGDAEANGVDDHVLNPGERGQIGRASCRERGEVERAGVQLR